jgi:hypothetical protein
MICTGDQEPRKAYACLRLWQSSETVKGAPLALQGVDHIEGGDCLPPRVLSVGHRVADDALEEVTEDTADLFVDIAADTLHTASAREPADGGLRNALDVFAHDLSMTLRATFPKTFPALAATGHCERKSRENKPMPR